MHLCRMSFVPYNLKSGLKISWLSLILYKKKIFPNFPENKIGPWLSLMLGTLLLTLLLWALHFVATWFPSLLEPCDLINQALDTTFRVKTRQHNFDDYLKFLTNRSCSKVDSGICTQFKWISPGHTNKTIQNSWRANESSATMSDQS